MIYFFLKYFEERQYAEEFLAGNLYLNPLAYFKAAEVADGRGDANEAPDQWLQPEGFRLEIGGHVIPREGVVRGVIQDAWHDSTNLLCMYACELEFPATLESLNEQARIPAEVQRMGPWVVLVHNVSEFFRRFDASIRREGFGLARGSVTYFDGSTYSGRCENPAFWKEQRFAWQREYRFAVRTHEHEPRPLRLAIGDVSDICVLKEAKELDDPAIIPKAEHV